MSNITACPVGTAFVPVNVHNSKTKTNEPFYINPLHVISVRNTQLAEEGPKGIEFTTTDGASHLVADTDAEKFTSKIGMNFDAFM